MTRKKIYWLKYIQLGGEKISKLKVIIIIYFFLLRLNLISSNSA